MPHVHQADLCHIATQGWRPLGIAALLVVSSLAGCNVMFTIPPPNDAKSLLKTIEASRDSVTLEILQVRVAARDSQLYDELWQAVDEQRLAVDVRHNLVRNGFRAGVLSGTVPDSLARELNLQNESPKVTSEQVITPERADPQVKRRVLQLSRHEGATIQASDVRSRVDVLVSDSGGVRGRPYRQVQAVYTMRAETMPGQRVELRLIPELRHGELKNRYEPSDQGIFLMTQSRERDTFDELQLTAALAAGEFLIVSCLPDAPGSLGHAFHAHHAAGPAEHKLVLVRLVQVPPSDILANAD